MSESNVLIAFHLAGGYTQALQIRVEKNTAAGAGFAVNDADTTAGEVLDILDVLGIAACGEDALFPHGIRDHGHGVSSEAAPDLGEIRFAAGVVAQMRACHVDTALLQQFQRLRTVAM